MEVAITIPELNASARDFLNRAKVRLSEAGGESLLYAALELRLGIEARHHEYLDAAEEVAVLKKRGREVATLAKDLERVFKTGGKIASLEVLNTDRVPTGRRFLFTPVPKRANQVAQRLGDFLH